MYGIGARLDVNPGLLFTLRGVDHEELIAVDAEAAVTAATASGTSKRLATSDMSDVFGIDLDSGDETNTAADAPSTTVRTRLLASKSAAKKITKGPTTKRKKPSRASKGKTKRKTVRKKKTLFRLSSG
jgi:uncharacterized Zn finger protein